MIRENYAGFDDTAITDSRIAMATNMQYADAADSSHHAGCRAYVFFGTELP